MQLIIDIGNSNIVIALFQDGIWAKIFRYESKENQPQLYYEKGLRDILMEWSVKPNQINGIAISSVVPDLNDRLMHAAQHAIGIKPILISSEHLIALDMHVPKPYEIGTDLVANAYAAIKKYDCNAIVVDFGTALTFTVVHRNRGILGVTIAPGLKTAIQSLAGNTAQLPMVPLQMPHSAIGLNTSHAIQAGIVIGYKGLVKEIVTTIKAELIQEEFRVIATGGLSFFVESLGSVVHEIDKNLTLDGIRLISESISKN